MNEAGLVISTLWLRNSQGPPPDQRPPLVSPLWFQYQLDTCATLQDMIANDSRVRMGDTTDHFLVCDRSGACAAVEFVDGQARFHHGDALPVKALTNSAYPVALKAWQQGHAQENSLHRFAIVADWLAAAQPADTTLQHTLSFLDQWGGTDISPLEVEVLERGVPSFPCAPSAAPYQQARRLTVSPVLGWAALALAHRLWPEGIAAGLAVAVLVVWRVRAFGTRSREG